MTGRRWEVGIVLVAVALYIGLAVSTARQSAATFDEGSHLPAGYTYLTLRDFRMNPEHPPLIKQLAAMPLLLAHIKMAPDDVAWRGRRQWEFGRRFLYQWNDADRVLLCGRLPIIALGALLAVAVFLWTRRLEGRLAAGVALLLCVLSPDVLAHGSLVTTDLGIALFFFLSVVALERLRDGITPCRVAALAAAFALAVATKFSALLLVPTLAALALVLVFRAPDLAIAWRGKTRRLTTGPRLFVLGGVGLVALVSAWLLLWACFSFRYASSPDPTATPDWSRVLPTGGPVRAGATLAVRHRLLPEAVIFGFLRFYGASEARPSFLLGEISNEGRWYFFPVTFALKTPLPLLVLLLAAAALSLRRLNRPLHEWFLWLPPLLYFALVMTRSLNIGHRHLLPVYPFLFVLAGRAAAAGLRQVGRAPRLAVGALLAWYAGGTLGHHPHHLAYFNELIGGPKNGYRYLVDSNLDWGQDLKALKAWMDAQGLREITLSYFGSADPDYYGIHGQRLPGQLRPARLAERIQKGDIVAVSATHLQGVYLADEARRLMQRFRAETPLARVGYSILVYRAPEDLVVPRDAGAAAP